MTVAELIEALEDFDETAEVVVQDDETMTQYDVGSAEGTTTGKVLLIVTEL
jgi:hypothetical protein